jgi:hypothetical protein
MRYFQATLHGGASVSDAFMHLLHRDHLKPQILTNPSPQYQCQNVSCNNIRHGSFLLDKEEEFGRQGKSWKIKIARRVCIRVDSARFLATAVGFELKDHQTAAGN